MSNGRESEAMSPSGEPERLGWKTLAWIVALHAVALAIATYPTVFQLKTTVPEKYDTPQHLWIMLWYKTCLLEGQLPWFCPQIQYPLGAPLGNFTPLHIQSLLYMPLSFMFRNDVFCYNIVWLCGFMMTGLGTSLLCWHVLRDRTCAAFGGLLGMLSGPMMIHSIGHTELIYIGGFPIFLVAWMRFVDRPSLGRATLAAACYVLVAMSAAYYLVFAVFPAALYVGWAACRAGTRGVLPWIKARMPWFIGWSVIVLPFLVVLFSSQVWAIAHGNSISRSRDEFNLYGSPLWTYVLPTPFHALGVLISKFMIWKTGTDFSTFRMIGFGAAERSAYLGVVTVGLLAYALAVRARGRNVAYLWAAFVLIVVLSMGSSQTFFGYEVSLPAGWLWRIFPPMRLTRVPARFCLFAAVVSAVLASVGLKHLLARLPGPFWRSTVLSLLTIVAVADLSRFSFPRDTLVSLPPCYEFIRKTDPNATILEAPFMGSGGSALNAACTYWQTKHRLTTSAGYSGQPNVALDILIGGTSPLSGEYLAKPGFLENPGAVEFDLNGKVDFVDYLWLYLTVHKFDFIVLHQWEGSVPERPVRLDRVKALLKDAKVYEDAMTIVYARSKLKTPTKPVQLILDGWQGRTIWGEHLYASLLPKSRVALYSPNPNQAVSFTLTTSAVQRSRSVRLINGEEELARWTVETGRYQLCSSPPFRLPEGIHELTFESRPMDQVAEKNRQTQIRVTKLNLDAAPEIAISAGGLGGDGETRRR